MDSVQRFINVSTGDPFYEENRVMQREPISSSDVYIEPAPSMGAQQEAFTAELCINGVAVDASIQGRLIV
tara:strand:+ start:10623 stop:10832 length:210 start_codon:yes stop_codon:yes gene_type:complete